MGKPKKQIWFYIICELCILFACLFMLFAYLYRYDNKYTAGPPYGKDGVFTFSDSDLSKPIYLIDGWKFYPNQLLGPEENGINEKEFFIGQYSTFSKFTEDGSPFGSGTYRLTLLHDGAPRLLTLEIPEIFTEYTLWVQDEKLACTKSGSSVTFLLDQTAVITLQTKNNTHYYSGLTYPPALGTPGIINRLFFIKNLFYSVLSLVPLTLALFSLIFWAQKNRDTLRWQFGLLCLWFVIPCLHPFVWQLGFAGRLWYALQDMAWCMALAQAAAVASAASDCYENFYFQKLIRPLTLGLSVLCFLCVYFVIPYVPHAAVWYGYAVAAYRIACWLYLVFCTLRGLQRKDGRSFYVLGGCCLLGISLCANLWDNGTFEPIYTGWQLEYAMFFLVLIFGGLMGYHNLRLLRQEEELKLVKLQNRLAIENAAQMRQNINQVRSLKHELIHHVNAIEVFSQAKDYGRLDEYIEKLRKEKEALPPLYYCDNYFVNAILSSHMSAAHNAGIQTTCKAALPPEINLPDTDLCILFSNLLDNAREGCERAHKTSRRFIRLCVHMEGQLLSILCTNSAAHSTGTRNILNSTKANPEEHGYGIAAIKKIVERYEGALEITNGEDTFIVKILLYIPPWT